MTYEYEFLYENDDGQYQVLVEISSYGENYGADADGRRGVFTIFHEIEAVTVTKVGDKTKIEEDHPTWIEAFNYFEKYHQDKALEKADDHYNEEPEYEHDEYD